ncbi:polyprenyl synthetase family protein [Campylobacter sp. FMV-PI01]|uniref:Polyprenyl synthetase family protein n=1 Tax=Campylobacter portucalensis TaxID=2608384 RepID=A0A6L5WFM6_9BACT|nr:polyprenyl synthetase family protein [Campylobacter portucalensis]MSN95878.1 polyprenyl synthetase family protein [Campylobacter portucalensis]
MSFTEFIKENALKADIFHPNFEEALNYLLLNGGKYFRSQLLLGVVETLDKSMLQNAYNVAMAVEMIHTYSLIHDDLPLMDNADLRRGKIATHKKYGEVDALLVGDALNSYAFYMISSANLSNDIKIKCIQILSKSAYDMVLGQALDCHFEKQNLNIDELKILHNHKTGALIAGSFEIGAVISGLKNHQKIYEIGKNLGLLFQINDDIIDVTLTSKEAGKPTNNDKFKNSFVNLIGLEKSIKIKNELINSIILDIEKFEPKLKNLVLNLIEKYLKG